MDTKESKSLGLLDEIMSAAESSNEENKNSRKEELQNSSEEEKIKSGYRLRESTIMKLNEMKVYMYPPRTNLEDIVDEAICKLYESKKGV